MTAKSMHAMVIERDGRHAILLGFDASFPSRAAFTLAHEIGHIALGHLGSAGAIVDLDEVGQGDETDEQEIEADRFALSLLTGSEAPEITTSLERYNARSLAAAVVDIGPGIGIEPGTLALCLAYRTGEWGKAMRALRYIYGEPMEIWRYLNGIADDQLGWDNLTDESADYLKRMMGAGD
jgi:hypothetical protein